MLLKYKLVMKIFPCVLPRRGGTNRSSSTSSHLLLRALLRGTTSCYNTHPEGDQLLMKLSTLVIVIIAQGQHSHAAIDCYDRII